MIQIIKKKTALMWIITLFCSALLLPAPLALAQNSDSLTQQESRIAESLVIFARPGCPYCAKAQTLAAHLAKSRSGFVYRYVDVYAEDITKEKISKIANKPIETWPQIFLNGKLIGGYTDFEAYAKTHWDLN